MNDPLQQAKAKAAATYDAAADHFDDEPLGFWERIGRNTVARLGLPTGVHALDVGWGTGASALTAAQAIGPSGSVLGVDLAVRLLERARTKAMNYGLTNIEFQLADMTALGYPGVMNVEVTAEEGSQPPRSAEDWWTIALGSGLRWTIDQMGPEATARVKTDNVQWLSENKIRGVEINAIYAIGKKPS